MTLHGRQIRVGRILSLDIGEKRVGLAISDDLKMIAIPLKFVRFNQLDSEIENLQTEYDIDEIVAGLPRNMDGTEGSLAGFVRDTMVKIKDIAGEKVKVSFADETLTSVEAMKRLRERKKGIEEKGEIDTESAAVILENYLKENYAE